MSRPLLLLTFGLALGCGHTHAATDVPAAAAPVGPASEPVAERPAKRRAPSTPGTPPLFASPEEALAPDGLAKIQVRLVKSGELADADASGHLDEATKRALVALQRKRNLPATGVPDDVTVRALGLDPAEIFRRAPK